MQVRFPDVIYNKKQGDRIAFIRILEELGNPQKMFPSVHIAGTNGKGSVATYMTQLLLANNFCVGTLSSPHLFSFNERIKINGESITNHELEHIYTETLKFKGAEDL